MRNFFCNLAVAAFCLALTAQGETAPARALSGHLPSAVAGAASTGRLDANRHLRLAIGLPLRNQPELAQFLHDLYDPASPQFHHYLSVVQFTERFGPAPEDYEALAAFAVTNGLAVTARHSNRVVLDVEGPVSAIEQALHITLRTYRHPVEARDFFAPDQEPSIDANLNVLHIGGLDNFQLPRPLSKLMPPGARPGGIPALGSGGGAYLGNDFRAAYIPGVTLTGAGQTVGLLEFDSGFSQSDITVYESLAGLPNVPVTAVLLDGYDGSLGNANDEVSLDIEMAIAMAPGLSSVIVYEGDSTDSILNRMASDNVAKQLSASWTYGIDSVSLEDFQEFAAQGQSFFNASGDGDAWVDGIGTPCDSTNITIVGGTTLYTSGPGGTWQSETVWNEGYDPPGWAGTDYWGSGGGVSTVYPIPSWQQGIDMTASKGSTTMRNIPDVALTADNIFVVYGGGGTGIFSGTSCAAPLWAGFTALINQLAVENSQPTVGFLNPALYAIGKGSNYASSFHDIVTGNNTNMGSDSLYFAVPGYDLCTGWGTPAGQALINALVQDGLGITPAAGFAAHGPPGGPFTNSSVTFVLTNASSSALNWSSGSAASWLTVQPTNGMLLPGQAATAVLSLTSSATNLPEGAYTATVWFTNQTDGYAQGRQNTLAINPPSVQLGAYGAALLALQPQAYWPLNESITPPPADVVTNSGLAGRGANGFPSESPDQGQAGIVSNCIYFSNSNLVVGALGAHVDVPNLPALNPAGPFTVEFWANPNQLPNDLFCPASSIDDNENDGNSRYGWVFYETSAQQWEFRLGNSGGYVATLDGGSLLPQTWQHVVGVYDGTNATLYVNGVAVAGPTQAAGYAPNANSTVPLRFGATGLNNRTFDGAVDELAIYTNALSASTILAHYQAATVNNAQYGAQILAGHPAGYWRFDEPAYSAVSAGALPEALNLGSLAFAANGTYQPGTAPGVAGVTGAGFSSSNLACAFNGSSYIDVPGGAVSFTGALTISAWVNGATNGSQTESVVSLGAGSYELTVDALGYAHFVDGQQSFGSLVSASRVNDGHWHQLVGGYDGTNSEYFYVDGILAASSANATAAPQITGNDLWIGGDPDTAAFQFFDGAIDEVAVWSRALSAAQVQALYSASVNAPGITVTAAWSGTGVIGLSWPAVVGQSYEVQYTTTVIHPTWNVLGNVIVATNSAMTFQDSTTNAQRYYRIVRLP